MVKGERQGQKPDAKQRTSLEFLGYRVEHGAPRPLIATTELAILVFTNGAFGEETGIGFIDGVPLANQGLAHRSS